MKKIIISLGLLLSVIMPVALFGFLGITKDYYCEVQCKDSSKNSTYKSGATCIKCNEFAARFEEMVQPGCNVTGVRCYN